MTIHLPPCAQSDDVLSGNSWPYLTETCSRCGRVSATFDDADELVETLEHAGWVIGRGEWVDLCPSCVEALDARGHAAEIRAGAVSGLGIAMLIVYLVVAVAVPVIAVVVDGPDPDPAVFVFVCFFALLWPVYVPFVLLWWAAKGLANRSGGPWPVRSPVVDNET